MGSFAFTGHLFPHFGFAKRDTVCIITNRWLSKGRTAPSRYKRTGWILMISNKLLVLIAVYAFLLVIVILIRAKVKRKPEVLWRNLEALWIDLRAWLEHQADVIIFNLYDYGLPWRCVDETVHICLVLIVAIGLLGLLFVTSGVLFPFVEYCLLALARWWYSSLVFLGGLIGMNGDSFATYVNAQILADMVSAAVLAVFVYVIGARLIKKSRRGQGFPTHDLKISGYWRQENDNRTTTLLVKVSNANGDEPAIECRARVTFIGLSWRDIVDIPNASVSHFSEEVQSTNYFKTTSLSFRLPWEHDELYQTILSGESALLPILTFVPDDDATPQHFGIRCINDERTPHVELGVALRPLRQYGTIRITPKQGRYHEQEFQVHPVQRQDWQISA
jgi:hypothetical protein